MANIRVVSICNVQAADSTLTNNINLTSSDVKYLLVYPIQKGLLYSRIRSLESDISTQNLVKLLKTSLSRTLDFFFPLAGRLATIEQEHGLVSFFIDCNNNGAPFVHAVADNVTVSDILKPIVVPAIVHSLFPLNGMKNCQGVSKPLLAVQVTELADGIFIGFTVNHAVADGTTFWNFINSWFEICRGNNSDIISKPPVFEHWFRGGSYCPVRFPSSILNADDGFTLPPLQKRIFHFSKENIAKLKAKANKEAGVENISTMQSLSAHVWKSVTRNRQLDPEEEIEFRISIGIRSRKLDSPMPKEYFGNGLQGVKMIMKAREILENGLGFVALHINKLIGRCDQESIRNNIECWSKKPELTAFGSVKKKVLWVSCLQRFDVYGNDFGWGRPIAIRSGAGNQFDGMTTVYPGAEEGSIDIEVSLPPQVMQAMGNDSQFIIPDLCPSDL